MVFPRAGQTVLALVFILLWTISAATPASAHTTLISTTPADGSRLETAPRSVTFEFSESVELELGGLAVFDDQGGRVDRSAPVQDGGTVTIRLKDDLGDGTYIATYRVVSQDGHPVNGAIVFTAGDAPESTAFHLDDFLGDDARGAEALAAFARFVAYATGLVIGGMALYRRVDSGGTVESGSVRFVRIGAGVGAVASLLAIPLQAVIATGRGTSAAWDSDLLRRVVEDDVGLAAFVTAIGLAVLAWRPCNRLSWIAGLTAVVGFAITGHSRVSTPVAVTVTADVVHLVAAAIWVGGLSLVFLSFRTSEPRAVAHVVRRFSAAAFVTYAAAVGAGIVLAWSEVRALQALTSTTYGWVLLAKVAAVGAVGAIALYNRRRLMPIRENPSALRRLGLTVTLELAGFLVIVAATTLLVNVTPARTEAGVTGLYAERRELTEELTVEMIVDPNQAGRLNEIHLFINDLSGRPVELTDVEVGMAMPDRGIEPVRRRPFRAGPGHLLMSGRELSIPGAWQITITAQLDEFTRSAATFEVPVS